MKQIEQFFESRNDGEFGANSRGYPYRVICPREADSCIVYATKWSVLAQALDECGPPIEAGMIIRYGLPNRDDLSWLRSTIGNRRVLFLGDLDPTDLLILVWLRFNLNASNFEHFGVNNGFLADLHVTLPESYTIKLTESEIEAFTLLETIWPDLEASLGPACLQHLKNGRKIEQEAVVSALGSQAPILKLLDRSAAPRTNLVG